MPCDENSALQRLMKDEINVCLAVETSDLSLLIFSSLPSMGVDGCGLTKYCP